MDDNYKSIFGCLVSSMNGDKNGDLFRDYVWGEKSICDALKKLNYENYGEDLVLALFKFYVNPIPYLLPHLKEIESYRRKEKSVGIPIIVNEENFFNKSEAERYDFLRQTILGRMDLLEAKLKRLKLDTNMELLKADLQKILHL